MALSGEHTGIQRVSAKADGWVKNQFPVSDGSGFNVPFELGHKVIFLNSEAEGTVCLHRACDVCC